jgi:hypothetical protein
MPNQKAEEKVERPKLIWEDGLDNDVITLRERRWKNLIRNRQIWQNLISKAVAQKGLFCRLLLLLSLLLLFHQPCSGLFLVSWGGVRLSPLGTSALLAYCTSPGR